MNSLCEDILYRQKKKNSNIEINSEIINEALLDIESTLNKYSMSLLSFNQFPEIEFNQFQQDNLLNQYLNYDQEELQNIITTNYSTFNQEQLDAYTKIIDSYKDKSKQKIFFVHGCGGTGKHDFSIQSWLR